MQISLAEIVARARTIAEGRGADPFKNPIIDNGLTVEALVPHAMRRAFQSAVAADVLSSSADHELEIIDAEAVLPDSVLRKYLDEAFLPDVPRSSHIPFPDYGRSRYDNLLCYFTTKNGKIYYSCDIPKVTRAIATIQTNGNTAFIVDDDSLVAADVGKRLSAIKADGSVMFDGIIETIVDANNGTVRGNTLLSTLALVPSATIYETADDVVDRSITDLVTNTASQNVTSATAAFTAADEDRRLRAYQTGTLTPVIDAIIESVTNPTTAVLRGKPLSTQTACDASILYSALTLNAPTIPEIPTDPDEEFTMGDKVATDTILILAGAFVGEISIKELMEADEA